MYKKYIFYGFRKLLLTLFEVFSKIANPITKLQKKNKKFVWS
jgi:hypothetical protein